MPSVRESAMPVAIIGIGLRLPGGISTSEEFWDLLVNGKDGRCKVPIDRYNVDGFFNDASQRESVASQYGYFLKDVNLQKFDASFFGSKKAKSEMLDPQQRLLLEVVWECMESAGQTKLQGTRTGVFVGTFGEDWHNILQLDKQGQNEPERLLYAGDYAMSNMVSHEYNFTGPSITVRTACSSSISSLHFAFQALQNGDCSTAIVAGTSIIMEPSMTLDMSQIGVLSSSGSCKTFDATADGYSRGEAINAILIKPLDEALHDGDPIRAVIRSTALNSGGKTPQMTQPSLDAQEDVMKMAYKMAGINDFSQTPFIECHGTGTMTGDPIEAAAVARVFGGHGVYIGSVKPNVGHGEGASGLTSIIKAVLSLENETIPPNINLSNLNPKIGFREHKLKVPLEPIPWPTGRHTRISVNSFGIGGANAHAILESAASFGAPNYVIRKSSEQTGRQLFGALQDVETSKKHWPRLLPISANSKSSLQRRVEDIRQYIESHPMSLNDITSTLGLHRIHLRYRTFCTVEDGTDVIFDFKSSQKTLVPSTEAPEVAFVFTGQGAQWVGMGESLVCAIPSFRQDIQKMDRALKALEGPPSWTIEGLLSSSGSMSTDAFREAEISQPLCTAIQLALVNFLGKCNISASVVIGHSSGEIAAAYAAGALTMSEAIVCAYIRGQVTRQQTRRGRMAAVGLDRNSIVPLLHDGAYLACENSPKSVTISGDEHAVEQTLGAISVDHPDVSIRKLHVDIAYHSDHMREIGATYEEMLKPHLSSRYIQKPFYSTATGNLLMSDSQLDPEYWRMNLESPVLFRGAMQSLLEDMPDTNIILELGPHSALQGPIRQILQASGPKTSPRYMSTLKRDNDCLSSLLDTIGSLYQFGSMIDFGFLNPPGAVLTDLPNYPWDHSSNHRSESRVSKSWRQRKHPHHELLGSRCLEPSDVEPIWRNMLQSGDVPWLGDHRVETTVVFPCAGYIAMMGEALRQFLGSDSYTLQNLVIKAALVLPVTEYLEVMTTVRPSRSTEFTNSSWYDISISSLNKTVWVENCIAQGRPGNQSGIQNPGLSGLSSCPRKISKHHFYERMQHMGLRYGPYFQGLTNISAHTEKEFATATMRNAVHEQTANYAVHPTSIDYCLQLSAVASCRGVFRRMTLGLPVGIQKINISPGGPVLVAEAAVDRTTKCSNVIAVDELDNKVVVKLERAKVKSMNTGEEARRKEELHTARLEWLPDINHIAANNLFTINTNSRSLSSTWIHMPQILGAIERVASLGVLQILDTVQSLDIPVQGYLAKYIAWLQVQKSVMAQGGRDKLDLEIRQWVAMDVKPRQALLTALVKQVGSLQDANALHFARLIENIARPSNVQDTFTGRANPVGILSAKHELNVVYHLGSEWVDSGEFFRLCAHSKPTLRVLDIGSGMRGTVDGVLKNLISSNGVRMYSHYMFTDVSTAFFHSSQVDLKNWQCVEFKVLDIERDPKEQGFKLESYDLIVASNVIHTTRSLQKALRNVRSLLRPGGRLYLHELVPQSHSIATDLVMGYFPSWWSREEDNRPTLPYVSVERWNTELRNAGFSGTDSVAFGGPNGYHLTAHMTSTVESLKSDNKSLTFLYRFIKPSVGLKVEDALREEGVTIHWHKLGDQGQTKDNYGNIISFLDLETPFFENISHHDYNLLKEYISAIEGGILWLTGMAQLRCTDPSYGLVLGFARTMRVELALEFWTIELESFNPSIADIIAPIIRKFRRRSPSDEITDREYCVCDGIVHVGRCHWTSIDTELESKLLDYDPKQLVVGQAGLVDSLHWVQNKPGGLQADEVEIEVRCVGLNFRDIMAVMGIVEDPEGKLGLDASGIITRVGAAVDHVKIGDHVLAVSGGLCHTKRIISGTCVFPIPPGLSFQDAATLPTVYLTAIYAILYLGRLKQGQSILIHSAAGGVGQAAIHICQMLGVKIYATVGREEKVRFLIDQHNIPRERIFNSHNDSFLEGVMEATSGQGVDLVLNSLSGDLLHASWQCVAECGSMMEIGKRDILERGKLQLDMFGCNRTFYGIDLWTLHKKRPDILRSLADQFSELYEKGCIKPIRPIHAYPAKEASNAFRFMKSGQHTGKVILTMPENPKDIPVTVCREPLLLSGSSTYLIIGGLGGLGKAVATWMVEKGATSFVFLSRSAGKSSKDKQFLNELKSQNCKAVAVAGSVAEAADVKRAIDAAPTPITGVLQLSMVLRDRPFSEMTYDDWTASHDPKVKGTWNLHNALLGTNLDFFLLMSSLIGTIGLPCQANYASANSFLDSFVQYRHSLGLPCSVIDLGCMEGIGVVSETASTLHRYTSMGMFMTQEQDLVDAIHLSIKSSKPPAKMEGANTYSPLCNISQLAVGLRSTKPLSDPTNRAIFKGDVRADMYHNMESAFHTYAGEEDGGFRALLYQVETNPKILDSPESLQCISTQMGRTLFGFLGLEEDSLDIGMSLESLGIDSLIAIELRNWLRRTLGLSVTILEITNAETIEGLGKFVIQLLQQKYRPSLV